MHTMYKERSGSVGSRNAALESLTLGTPHLSSTEKVAECLEDARKLIRELRQKTISQAQQIITWRRAYKMQELLISGMQKENCDHLKALSTKILLLESRLIRKQKDISAMLNIRENLIYKQQRVIETLSNRLTDHGLEVPLNELNELELRLPDLESLNDSDSAVVMEDIDSDSNIYHVPRFRSGSADGITVARSISDAMDPNLKYTFRRNTAYLKRPDILETVYSVEEDTDEKNDNLSTESQSEANKKRDAFANRGKSTCYVQENSNSTEKNITSNEKVYYGVFLPPSYDQINENNCNNSEDSQDENVAVKSTSQVKTYNRVMSNHRSVTKPKDVKYKRINKAKSKSLEELRGRLKSWVEHGNKRITLEHSHSYA